MFLKLIAQTVGDNNKMNTAQFNKENLGIYFSTIGDWACRN